MRFFRSALLLCAVAASARAEDVDFDYSTRHTQVGFLEQAGDRTCAAGDYWIAANSTLTVLRHCANGVIATIGAGGAGEANTASNVGGGLANWDTKVGVDLRFNSFAAVDFDLAANLISIDAALARDAEVAAAYQPLDADLTSIAALATTTGGRSVLADTLADDQVPVADDANGATWRTIPDCDEAGTLNYTQATNTFSCLTDSGGGGGGNSVETTLALSGGAGYFSATVTGQAWVTTSSEIVCSPLGTTADGLTPEAVAVAALSVSTSDRVAATGFNVNVWSPYGLDGTIRIHCLGV